MLHTRKSLGPLRGVPISVKEHIGMKGLRLNAEYIAWWDETAKEDAHVLQVLQRVGAVFHARTTQTQSLMHLETDSNLYGVWSIHTIVTSRRVVSLVEKEHWSCYRVVVWGLGRMLEASHRLVSLTRGLISRLIFLPSR